MFLLYLVNLCLIRIYGIPGYNLAHQNDLKNLESLTTKFHNSPTHLAVVRKFLEKKRPNRGPQL